MKKHLSLQLNSRPIRPGFRSALDEHSGDHGNLGYNELRHDSGASPRMFCEESLGKVNAKDLELFRNRLVYKFYCLTVVITLEQVVE